MRTIETKVYTIDEHPNLIKELEDATEEEYRELEEELTVIGYDLTVVPGKESN